MFALGFISGLIASAFFIAAGLYCSRYFSRPNGETIAGTAPAPGVLFRRRERKKPKSVSELDQWRREQEAPPGDPT